MKEKNKNIRGTAIWICITAIFTALTIAICPFHLPVPGGNLYFVDVIICTASIILDPIAAFIVGGVGSFLGDLLFYPAPMFVSLVTHGIQAVVISVFSHHILKSKPVLSSGIGVVLGAITRVAGYTIGKTFFYGAHSFAVALTKLPFEILQAVVGAVLGMLISWKCGINKMYQKLISHQYR